MFGAVSTRMLGFFFFFFLGGGGGGGGGQWGSGPPTPGFTPYPAPLFPFFWYLRPKFSFFATAPAHLPPPIPQLPDPGPTLPRCWMNSDAWWVLNNSIVLMVGAGILILSSKDLSYLVSPLWPCLILWPHYHINMDSYLVWHLNTSSRRLSRSRSQSHPLPIPQSSASFNVVPSSHPPPAENASAPWDSPGYIQYLLPHAKNRNDPRPITLSKWPSLKSDFPPSPSVGREAGHLPPMAHRAMLADSYVIHLWTLVESVRHK